MNKFTVRSNIRRAATVLKSLHTHFGLRPYFDMPVRYEIARNGEINLRTARALRMVQEQWAAREWDETRTFSRPGVRYAAGVVRAVLSDTRTWLRLYMTSYGRVEYRPGVARLPEHFACVLVLRDLDALLRIAAEM